MESHGAWHNLYIGLGAVPNPFGIEWVDTSGMLAVKRIDPTIKYISADYYNALRNEYFRILEQHPLEAADVYFRKFVVTINTNLQGRLRILDVKTSIIIVGALFAFAFWRRKSEWKPTDAALAVASIFVCFFLGQATLLHFDMQYLFPIQLFLIIGGGAVVESIIRAELQGKQQ
jgi:hypothetical protein